MYHKRKNSAFTLVELAIVIVIIGLLVGGVLQGQELIKQAQIRSNIKKIEEIRTASATFLAKYNCIPGDCNKGAALGLIYNGDGDGRLMLGTGQGSGAFWYHLTTAKLLNVLRFDGQPFSVSPSLYARFRTDRGSDPAGTYKIGTMYPSFSDIYSNNDPSFPFSDANAIFVQANLITIATYTPNGYQANAAFTADEAGGMDTKSDDGIATTGKFYSTNARDPVTGAGTTCHNSGVYVNDNTSVKCRVLFELGM